MDAAKKHNQPFLMAKNIKFWIITGFLILALTMSSIADDMEMALSSKGNLQFQADCYQFAGNSGQTRVEIAYSFSLSQFDKKRFTGDSLVLTIDLQLLDQKQSPLFSVSEKKTIRLGSNSANNNDSFIDLKKCLVAPGELTLTLIVKNEEGHYQGKIVHSLNIRDFSDRLSLSDPVFISYLGKARKDTVFDRQNIFILPDPQRRLIVTENQKELLFFVEVNNLDFNPQTVGFYSINGHIEDLTGKSLVALDHDALKKISKNTSRIEKIDLSQLPSGAYKLILNVSDPDAGSVYSAKRYFQIENSLIQPGAVLPMTETDIQKYTDQIKYIATDQEMEIFGKLDNSGKERFLLQFWKMKDTNPDTPENEFMQEHFRRIANCEQAFRGGINSDQARIYIKYGPPANIERSASTLEYSKPVEIWTYAYDGSIEFVFVDRTNDGNYVLVHSTHPAEYSNINWSKDF